MSSKNDLVVKMTIDSDDFATGLRNAKSSMKNFEKDTSIAGNAVQSFVKGAIKGFGALGLAVSSTEIFKTFLTSTQTLSDKWDNAMTAAKESFNSFATSVMTGNDEIIKNLRASVVEAYKFAEALNALESAKISNQYARLKYLNPLNQALTNAADRNATPEQRKESIATAWNYYNQYSQNAAIVRDSAKAEVVAWLRKELPEANITSGNAEAYIDNLYLNLINGVFDDVTKRFREVTSSEYWKGNALVNTPAQRMKSGEALLLGEGYSRNQINMARIYNRLAETPNNRLMQNLEAIKTYTDVEAELISLQRRINSVAGGGGSGGSGGGSSSSASSGLTIDQLTEYYIRMMQRVPIDKPFTPYEPMLLEEDIIEEETDAIVDALIARRKAMEGLAQQTAEAITMFNSLSSVFNELGKLSGDDMFGSIASGLGTLISTATQTISAMMALAGAETVEGIAEVFARTNGGMVTKIAVTATALAGILSMINTAKNAFAGSYAEGGIVGGNSWSGDKLWARVNSGEMILNRSQQAALMNGGNVKFVIEGSQLKGVLDNYESIQSM